MTSPHGFLVSVPWSLDYPGGVNEVVKNLSREIEKDGFQVIIHENSYRNPAGKISSGHIIQPLPALPNALVSKLGYWFYKLPAALLEWRRMIRKNRIRFVQVHYPVASSILFARLKPWTDIKLVCSLHGKDLEDIANDTINNEPWSRFFEACDVITTCSGYLKSHFLKTFPDMASKVHVLHNGIDMESMERERCTPGSVAIPEQPYVVNVATYEHKKGQDILLRGFARYSADESARPMNLVFAGRKGKFLEKLIELARELRIEDRVTFLTSVSHQDAIRLIDHAELFALPSRMEPFGIVLLEAGYCETPVIAHAVGGVTEFLKHGENSFLLKENREEAWAEALRCVASDRGEMAGYATRLNTLVTSQYSWSIVYEQFKAQL